MSLDLDWFGSAHLLIVEDDPAVQRTLKRVLMGGGFQNVSCVGDVDAALEIWGRSPPDLILVDLHLPGASGLDLLSRLRADWRTPEFLPVIMLTGDDSPDVRRRALNRGAHDFLTKPFDNIEVLLRIRNLLRTRLLNQQLLEANAVLEARVRERTANLEAARREALGQLARAAEFRDDVTGRHTQRVGRLAAAIALDLGWSAEDVDLMRSAAPLHDIGKIGIPDAVLMKQGSLTVEEFEVMKTHTTIGAAILAESRSPVFEMAREIALTHHERWDGTGYPGARAGTDIPLSGRIVCAADVFDALTNERPYKVAMPPEQALSEITANVERHFDPAVVAALTRVLAADALRDTD